MNLKHKIGDKVKIKSLDWYNTNKSEKGDVLGNEDDEVFINEMSEYCNSIATIVEIVDDAYRLNIDNQLFSWSDFMFDESFNTNENMETKEIILPDGWEIDKAEGNKIILKDSKKKLATTYEECLKLLGKGEYINSSDCTICEFDDCSKADTYDKNIIPIGLGKSIVALMQLLVCREVYRQGWKPDWTNYSEYKYVIRIYNGISVVDTTILNNYILAFQTREVRNEFFDNFKDLIEEAKEFL